MRSVRKTKLTLKNHRKTLGFLGVFLRKSRKSLKTLDFDDAVKARKEAEEKYFGKYSYNNSQQNNT